MQYENFLLFFITFFLSIKSPLASWSPLNYLGREVAPGGRLSISGGSLDIHIYGQLEAPVHYTEPGRVLQVVRYTILDQVQPDTPGNTLHILNQVHSTKVLQVLYYITLEQVEYSWYSRYQTTLEWVQYPQVQCFYIQSGL